MKTTTEMPKKVYDYAKMAAARYARLTGRWTWIELPDTVCIVQPPAKGKGN